MTSEILDGKIWHAPDVMASEYELGDFLYGIVRMVKPVVCIETGCYRGDTTIRIAHGIRDNGIGALYACDTDAERASLVQKTCAELPVVVKNCKGIELVRSTGNVDLALIDSGNDAERTEEALNLRISHGSIVVLHDAHRSTYAEIKKHRPDWRDWFIHTPRGLAVFLT